VIPFFLPVWRSALLRDAILGILLAAAALRGVDLSTGEGVKPDAGVSRAHDQRDNAANDAARAPLFPDSTLSKKK